MNERLSVSQAAALAKLSFSQQEEEALAADMAQILAFARQIQNIDTDHVSLTRHIVPLENVLREDTVQPSMPQEQLLAAAPACEGELIAVARTFD